MATNDTQTSAQERKFMLAAIKEAKKAEGKCEVPVGAVVVYEGKIIARAYNKRTTNHDPTAHAEVMALRNQKISTRIAMSSLRRSHHIR